MRLVDWGSRSNTRIVIEDRVSRSDTKIVYGSECHLPTPGCIWIRVSRSDTRIVLMDQSVTFRHQDNKENESWIMLIYSDLMNLFPNEYGGLSPHRCAWVVANGYGTCCFYLLSVMVDFTLFPDIYCFLFWVGRWYVLSTRVLYWLLLVCFLFVIFGVQKTYCRFQLNRNSSQSSSRQISGWAIVPSSDWILSHSFLDVLDIRTWTICLLILAS